MVNTSNNLHEDNQEVGYNSPQRKAMRASMIWLAKETPSWDLVDAVQNSFAVSLDSHTFVGLLAAHKDLTDKRTSRLSESFEQEKLSLRAKIIERYNDILETKILVISEDQEVICKQIIQEENDRIKYIQSQLH